MSEAAGRLTVANDLIRMDERADGFGCAVALEILRDVTKSLRQGATSTANIAKRQEAAK
jgi:hypothetical protein